MLEERELVRMAQQRAGEILDTANQEAAEVRRGADEYAAGVLIRLEGECIKALTSIKRGIDMLDERHRSRVPRRTATGALSVETEATEAAPTAMTVFNVAGLLREAPGAIREVAPARPLPLAGTRCRAGRSDQRHAPLPADQSGHPGARRDRGPGAADLRALPGGIRRARQHPHLARSSCRASIPRPARPLSTTAPTSRRRC